MAPPADGRSAARYTACHPLETGTCKVGNPLDLEWEDPAPEDAAPPLLGWRPSSCFTEGGEVGRNVDEKGSQTPPPAFCSAHPPCNSPTLLLVLLPFFPS